MEILTPAHLETSSGLAFTLRPITPADASILGEYFLGLSRETIDLYGPHPFTQATADKLCAKINPARVIRWIATLPGGNREKVIGYVILQMGIPKEELQRYAGYGLDLDPAAGCLIAPSVADAYQNRGLGSPMMVHILQALRRSGRKYVLLEGGVFAHNERAVHFYEKTGFRRVGTFVASWARGRPSYDMIHRLDGNLP